ncbi:MAG: phenylacetate--CoA ligase [Oscillospiraceae bacterium]|nr:phenylacetate--CoA ligase [Oscillospiraceae bacterium]
MIRDRKIECMPRDELKKLQSERLCALVARMYDKVELFRMRMDELGLKPGDIKGVEDLDKLPFSYKKDLRDYYPYGLFAEPLENVSRIHASSGTTGKRIVVGYTQNDIDMWGECIARMLNGIGLGKDDIVQVSFGYGLFTGGFGLHSGCEKIGATVIPISSGNTALQIQTMIDFKATALCCTPSYAMYLGEEIERLGVKDQLKLKVGIFGAEPWTEDMRKKIEESLNIRAYDIYGLSEVMGPGVACECEYGQGMHIWEDNFIVEIIDPDTGKVLPEGSKGELVFTALTKEAFPLIRYRTRDICSLNTKPCPCGRTHIRMNKPSGRSDDMLIIRGVNVFPSQIEEAILQVSGSEITPNYQIIVDRVNNTDTLDINVEMSEKLFSDDIDVKAVDRLEKALVDKMRSTLGIGAKIHLVNPKTIARSEGKAKRVIDNRKF